MNARAASNRTVAAAWLALALALLPFPAAVAEDPTAPPEAPHALMAGLSSRLFAALEREHAAIRRDPQRVLPIVDELMSPHFDGQYTARLVLGAHWRIASEEQRQRFATALYRTLLRTYAEAIADWTPDRFRLLPLIGDPAALQVLVRTEVTQRSGAVVRVDYRLHSTAGGWEVFDVLVDGISYAHSYHDDIDTEVSQRGLDAAILRMERRAATAGAHPSPPN